MNPYTGPPLWTTSPMTENRENWDEAMLRYIVNNHYHGDYHPDIRNYTRLVNPGHRHPHIRKHYR